MIAVLIITLSDVYPNLVVDEDAHACAQAYIRVNMAKAVPHFFIDNKAGMEVAQRMISIQLFKDFPFRVVVLFSLPKHPVWLSQLP